MSADAPDFRHVDAWVFDLDNTLYPSECDLFSQVDARMTEFVAQALGVDKASARAVQKRYYAEHGTTLAGLMKLHAIPPRDFLDYVHDIDLAPVEAAGCYAPGGRYPLPSSVLMTAATARAAGVPQVIVASPRPAPVTLAAAAVSGADAVLAASIFHFAEYSIAEAKRYMAGRGIEVRL